MSSSFFKSLGLFIALSLSLGILVIGVLSLRSYFTKASTSGAEPSNVRLGTITTNSADILWDTKEDAQGLIRYSSDPAAFTAPGSSGLLFTAEGKTSKTHQVKLSGLKPNTSYYYEISIKNEIYDQNGLVKNKHLPYSFLTSKTSAADETSLSGIDPAAFKQKFGSSDVTYDLNKDGTVNASDYLIYLSRTATPTP